MIFNIMIDVDGVLTQNNTDKREILNQAHINRVR